MSKTVERILLAIALAALLALVFYETATAVELPSFVTAKARAVCERDVRKYCVKPGVKINFSTIKNCVRRNFDAMSMDCRVEIVSLLPEIEKYEKMHRGK